MINGKGLYATGIDVRIKIFDTMGVNLKCGLSSNNIVSNKWEFNYSIKFYNLMLTHVLLSLWKLKNIILYRING